MAFTRDGAAQSVSRHLGRPRTRRAGCWASRWPGCPRTAVTVDLGGVGGPSAGLMFSLGIVDMLTPGDLTGGRFIAGTGAITADGVVQNIGGIQFKMAAARAPAPRSSCCPRGSAPRRCPPCRRPATGEGGHPARRRHRAERPERRAHPAGLHGLNSSFPAFGARTGTPHPVRRVGRAGRAVGPPIQCAGPTVRRPRPKTNNGACPWPCGPRWEPRRCPAVPGSC